MARRSAGGVTGADIVTQPYPGFATDLQAPVMALLAAARGASAITETVFEGLDHLDRGYDRITEKLVACGAMATRT